MGGFGEREVENSLIIEADPGARLENNRLRRKEAEIKKKRP